MSPPDEKDPLSHELLEEAERGPISRFMFWVLIGIFLFAAYAQFTDQFYIIEDNIGALLALFGFAGLVWLFEDARRGRVKLVAGHSGWTVNREKRPVLFRFLVLFYFLTYWVMLAGGVYVWFFSVSA